MKKYTLSKQKKTSKTRRKFLIISVIVIVAAGLSFGIYFLTKNNDKAHTNTRTTSEKGETQTSDNPSTTPSSQDSPSTSTDNNNKEGNATAPISPSAAPAAPSGTFISNHRPNLSGNPAPNKIQSTCITTSGAKCTIVFTKGDIRKSLDAQVADADGAVYWEWTLQDKGLTEGTWKVTATATLNGQTASTDDPISLEIKQ